jgi:error-prone DNA polymerase
MPEWPEPKQHPHPGRSHAQEAPMLHGSPCAHRAAAYAELEVTTNFTFLTGASHPDEYVRQAAALGYRAVAVTDTNTLSGIVRAHVVAEELGLPLIVGCRLTFHDAPGMSILAYPTDKSSYGRLCRLLTLGKRRAAKGQCQLYLHDLLEHQEHLLAVVVVPEVIDSGFLEILQGLRDRFDDDRLSIAASCLYGQDDRSRLQRLACLADHVGVPMVATNHVHYHIPQRAALQDTLTCVRHGCTIGQAGYRLFADGERYLKPPQEMARLFAEYPCAIERTVQIAERAGGFSLAQLKYQYPDEVVPPGQLPIEHLAELTQAGARQRYPRGVPAKVCQQIEHELKLIDELHYAHYFLTVHDLVMFARSCGILCQGRGAAANSAVCYCLGITAVDPDRIDILFERFVSRERNEPPDIDIDFEHERREEVIQYIYGKYGRDRAALTAEVISYRSRSAVRDVGKALGLSLDAIDRLAKNMDWWSEDQLQDRHLRELGFNPHEPVMRHLVALTHELVGFPRHLSQHVGGFVITRDPLCELVPIENAAMAERTVIEWDKDDIDALNMLKVDVLGLGMLTCVRKTFELIERHHDRAFTLATIPPEDPAVYDMVCAADTVGVFQIESRAQMTMLPRLRPRRFYDLVIEVAIVRPGPIQGQMVHPYLRRRNGEEAVTYPDRNIEGVLHKTLGVPLFQEQVMALAVVAAGFTPGEADELRRAISAWKSRGKDRILEFHKRFIGGMKQRGYDPDFAERCFNQIKGFGDYGFPESHAASFALLVYVSAWLKKHYPAAFAAALLNSQPMGFYAPAQIVRDAQAHGVEVRPVDVNGSQWDCTLEEAGGVLRLGMRLVHGLRKEDGDVIAEVVAQRGRFASIESLWRTTGVPVTTLRRLASADGFGSMNLDRQAALWQVRALRDGELPLFDQQEDSKGRFPADSPGTESIQLLPFIPEPRRMVQDYQATGLSLKNHPLKFLRDMLNQRRVTSAGDLQDEKRCPDGSPVTVAGLVLVRQRPSTASGIIFMTLEDETGISNLIVRPRVYERDRKAARHGTIIIARGRIERQGKVVHIMTHQIQDISHELTDLCASSRDFR